MRITLSETLKNVNQFVPEIRKVGIPLEDIIVVRDEIGYDEPKLFTEEGIIHVDQSRIYEKDFSNELLVLNALGHRAIEAINPDWTFSLLEKAGLEKIDGRIFNNLCSLTAAYFNGNASSLFAAYLGLPECLALDVFPEFCSVSDLGREYTEMAKQEYKKTASEGLLRRFFSLNYSHSEFEAHNAAKGYEFFHKIHSKLDSPGKFDTLKEFIEHIEDYPLPKKTDLNDPMYYAIVQGLWDKQNH